MATNRVIVRLEEITNSCFVAMPFDSGFSKQYESVLKPAIEEAGLTPVRGDEIYERQSIVQDIWLAIRKCRILIAELSGRNPNVMYEVGLAHAIGKPIILLTRSEEDVPYDLKTLRYIFYDTSNPFWGPDLKTDILRMVKFALERPELSEHLHGLEIETTLPSVPTNPVIPTKPKVPDLSGVWRGSWLTLRLEREHNATLIIPQDHSDSFIASLTVTFNRSDQQTILEETLSATYSDDTLTLTGVNYTYVRRGASVNYYLDAFKLSFDPRTGNLQGDVKLKNGSRPIEFVRSRLDECIQ